MAQVVALGEALVDCVALQSGVALADAPAFQPVAGGAPANVAVGVARLGVACAFLGKVGADPWGDFLIRTLHESGVDVRGVCRTAEARTALAFVSLQPDGERDFVFYRHPGADMLYEPDEVDAAVIEGASVLHVGSLSLMAEPARAATMHAVALAQQQGALLSYDPNVRRSLWPDEHTARQTIRTLWERANIIKVSEEELTFLAEGADEAAAVERLWHENLRLLAITCGAAGCRYVTPNARGAVSGVEVDTVDTTGAGDGWMAALLSQLVRQPGVLDDQAALEEMLRYANAAGALTTTGYGAIPALPTLAQIGVMMYG
jgi:fructokinase